jgi:DNA polymerase-3 subunit gamma/tau
VHLLFDMTLKGVSDVVRAQDPRIVLEMLLLRLSQAPRLTSIENLIANLQAGKTVTAKIPAKSSTNQNSQSQNLPNQSRPSSNTSAVLPNQAASGAIGSSNRSSAVNGSQNMSSGGSTTPHKNGPRDSEGALAQWPQLVENIKRDKPMLGAKLEYAAVQGLEGETLSITFKKEQEFFYSQVSNGEVVKQLMDLVGKYWGRPFKVEVKLGATSQGGTSSLQEERDIKQNENDKQIRAKVEANALVKEAKSVLKAKITSIKEQ